MTPRGQGVGGGVAAGPGLGRLLVSEARRGLKCHHTHTRNEGSARLSPAKEHVRPLCLKRGSHVGMQVSATRVAGTLACRPGPGSGKEDAITQSPGLLPVDGAASWKSL